MKKFYHLCINNFKFDMEALKNMPIGVQNFESLRKNGYFYVDKTALVYELVKTGKYYFLSRPRRFGKSMLQSTLHAYFEGKEDLFEGLAIEKLEKDWMNYPVLHLDLNLIKRGDPQSLDSILDNALCKWEKAYDLTPSENTFGVRFANIIERAKEVTGQDVVILVDEYDKPILEEIDNPDVQERQRETLKQFYGVLKNLDGYIKFALLTGVTKFSKVSVFSGLNNLYDISMDNRFVSICGMTDEELDTTFVPYIQRLATVMHRSYDEVREALRVNYDGYHFCENSVGIYNPFSLLCTFQSNKIKNYWFETGTPSYLVYLLKKYNYNLEQMSTVECDADVLNNVDSQSTNPIPVIYQSGYLTIKGYDPVYDLYRLGIPNKEVKVGFYKYLLPNYTPIDQSQSGFYVANFVEDVKAGKVDDFFKRLSTLFADTPYELVRDLENHYQNVLFIVAKLMGLYVKAEYHTSEGRIDLVLQTDAYTYVMEFKLNGTAEEALAQINDKNYALPFAVDNRKLIKVGVNFSSKARNIERWIIES
jgi:hypothetical protein